jgi:hypothetical protein
MVWKLTIEDLPKDIQKGVNFIKISKHVTLVNLVGSHSIKELHYANDYDLNELFKSKRVSPSHILKLFQEKYEDALKNPRIYITDFKLGGV